MSDEIPNSTWSMQRLRRRICGFCEQTLDNAKRGDCGSIYTPTADCYWRKELNKPAPPKEAV